MRSADDARKLVAESEIKLAMDSKLRQRKGDCSTFLTTLFDAGIIGLINIEEVFAECGLFVVPKKNGSLRLIWDTRQSNLWFEAPPATSLAPGEALAALELPLGFSTASAPSGDVGRCFYQYSLPAGLPTIARRYLPPAVRARLGLPPLARRCSSPRWCCPWGGPGVCI